RFNPVDCGQPFAVYVDYAHTPDAIERLCESARELTEGRLLTLFGCGGDRDKGKRPLMGKAGTAGSDFAVVSSDNPRGEDPLAIIEDIKPGLEGDSFQIVPDRREAIATILKAARDGDAVLLAGKGAENYQEIKGERHPFDDTAEAKKVLAEMGYSSS
ncbi:MAG: UDP-N-acetylmuramoyl-L-alanyl-D-glutamate--2,6-diaminopimelate ligase, partial [candidate division Zixibacteria bacterium]|nr:UDP-N-acetylmuramoyl-L-alanyl-D-glutamate--2,6-diaminopimelate ligase [candidate division Zixibacteria bacterium]